MEPSHDHNDIGTAGSQIGARFRTAQERLSQHENLYPSSDNLGCRVSVFNSKRIKRAREMKVMCQVSCGFDDYDKDRAVLWRVV